MIKVSVIIPVYNAEAYIVQSIQSVMDQTYSMLEILVIDDGSTDRSLEICKGLKQRDSRIRIFVQENKGVSSARNRGLEEASGKYVLFLDSDDAIHPCLLSEYVRQAESYHADILFCACEKLNTSRMKEKMKINVADEYDVQWICGKKSESGEWFHAKYKQELCYIGGKMIRRDFIGQQRFNERIFRGEDTVFIYNLIYREMRMSYLKLVWYFYRIHAKSTLYLNEREENQQKFEVCKIIRDQECQRRNLCWALIWEKELVWSILCDLLIVKNIKDERECQRLKEMMTLEMNSFLYRNLPIGTRMLFCGLFCGCLYIPFIRVLWRIKQMVFKGYSLAKWYIKMYLYK